MAEITYLDKTGPAVIFFWHKSIAINTVIAESLVNENFGNNMIPLNFNDLLECFSSLYSEISAKAGQTTWKNSDPYTARNCVAYGVLR